MAFRIGCYSAVCVVCCAAAAINANEAVVFKVFESSYTYEKNGDFAKAIEKMKWLNTNTSYEANLRLGWLHYCARQYSGSISYYEKAHSILPGSQEAQLGMVLPLSALGYWDKVIAVYQSILSDCPNNSAVCYKLGMVYYNSGDFKNAWLYFGKVVELYPFDYNGLLMYAWSTLKIGKLREAQGLFNKVLLCAPKDTSALEGLQIIAGKK